MNGEETATDRRVRSATPSSEGSAGTTPLPAPRRPETTSPADPGDATPAAPAVAPRRRLRVPLAHAVRRLPPPRQAAARGGRALAAWSRRPSGRLALPGLLLLTLVVTAGAAGAIVVPATARDARPGAEPTPAATNLAPDTALPAPGQPGLTPIPTVPPTGAPTGGAVGRPADVLASWAQQLSPRLGIPAVALQAYGYAELVLARTTPGCRLAWTTLAAIGKVESQHGRAFGATLGADGVPTPQIVGPPLNGQGGTQLIRDTDRGEVDGDLIYDRAVGPMQFIPTTWRLHGADADNDGVKNPNNIHDAALAAGNYLCNSGRNLTVAQDWWNAVLSYNDVRPYAQQVFDTANDYGRRSRT